MEKLEIRIKVLENRLRFLESSNKNGKNDRVIKEVKENLLFLKDIRNEV